MNERQKKLKALGVPIEIVKLVTQEDQNTLFEYRCGPLHYTYEHDTLPNGITVLWECTYGIVGIRSKGQGLEYVEFDIETPDEIEIIATSEQGLFFWLFSYLIEDQDWDDEIESLKLLRNGANTVGFSLLEEVLTFQEQYGANIDYGQRLLERSQEILA